MIHKKNICKEKKLDLSCSSYNAKVKQIFKKSRLKSSNLKRNCSDEKRKMETQKIFHINKSMTKHDKIKLEKLFKQIYSELLSLYLEDSVQILEPILSGLKNKNMNILINLLQNSHFTLEKTIRKLAIQIIIS